MTLYQRYSTLQKGYLVLEAKCERRGQQIQQLKDSINQINERHEQDTGKLAEQLDNKDGELQKLRGELDGVLKMSRTIKATVEKVSSHRHPYTVPVSGTAHLVTPRLLKISLSS